MKKITSAEEFFIKIERIISLLHAGVDIESSIKIKRSQVTIGGTDYLMSYEL